MVNVGWNSSFYILLCISMFSNFLWSCWRKSCSCKPCWIIWFCNACCVEQWINMVLSVAVVQYEARWRREVGRQGHAAATTKTICIGSILQLVNLVCSHRRLTYKLHCLSLGSLDLISYDQNFLFGP